MDYAELVKSLRICGEWGTEVRISGEPSECDGCSYYDAEKDMCKSWDEPWRKEHLLLDAADAIEKLEAYADLYRDGGETAMRIVEQYKTAYIAEHDARIEETKRNCPHYIRNAHDRGDDSLCTNFKCEISALSRWVPVKEQLPPYEVLGDLYLCCHVSGKYGQISWVQIDWWDGEKFHFKKSGKHDHITHWMPLPTPPKEATE